MSEAIFYNLKKKSRMAYTLTTQVACELGRSIVSGAYSTDSLIEDEDELGERYRVSRSVIRDAIRILVGKGLVETRRGIGTRVRDESHWGLLDDDVLAWHLSSPPAIDHLWQLIDFCLIIEPQAACWAAEYGADKDHEQIAFAQERMESEPGSIERFVTVEALFHTSILRATNNKFICAMEGVIHSTLLSSLSLTNKDPRQNESFIPLHIAVTDAILNRDGNQAEISMQKLLKDAKHRIMEELKDHEK